MRERTERFVLIINQYQNMESNMKTCFLFPGQGQNLNSDIANIQLFQYRMSVMSYDEYTDKTDDVVYAGHSLGEYAALTCAGVITREQAEVLLEIRFAAMTRAAAENAGKMVALLCGELPPLPAGCYPANFNSPAQTVVSGTAQGIDELIAYCKENKIRAVPLATAGAFHSPLMQSAADEFYDKASKLGIEPVSSDKVYSNLTGDLFDFGGDFIEKLALHIVSPVQWVKEIAAINADRYIEVKPGKVLSGLVKKIDPNAEIITLENI
jgi:(acyl-carrier-protein) S-malonyltransferase